MPLLAQQFRARLRRQIGAEVHPGRARGGEAVIMTENIRSFYDILMRREAPLPSDPLAALNDTQKSLSISPAPRSGQGIKP